MTPTHPLPILDELDLIRASGREVVPGSLIWLPHPTKPGLLVPAVETRVKACTRLLTGVEVVTVETEKEGIER
jgi:hypothetical protein